MARARNVMSRSNFRVSHSLHVPSMEDVTNMVDWGPIFSEMQVIALA